MLAVRNGTPSSRTPSPPIIAQRPRQPAPQKRRPCVRARSQTSLTRTQNTSPTGSRRTRSPTESPQAAERVPLSYQAEHQDLAICSSRSSPAFHTCDSRDVLEASFLSKSRSSPCLVIEGLHERRSQEQQKLVTSRNLLSEAFGAFNSIHRSVQKFPCQRPSVGAAGASSFASEQLAKANADIQRFSEKEQLLSDPSQHVTTNGKSCRTLEKRLHGATSPSDVCQVLRDPGHHDHDKVEEKRRKALDAKLLRDLVVLGM